MKSQSSLQPTDGALQKNDRVIIKTGEQLRKLRESFGYNREQMAEWLEVSWETYRGWEIGRKDKTGLRICLVGVPSQFLQVIKQGIESQPTDTSNA